MRRLSEYFLRNQYVLQTFWFRLKYSKINLKLSSYLISYNQISYHIYLDILTIWIVDKLYMHILNGVTYL